MNLQNVSSGDKSLIKGCFASRWGKQGKVGQIDFSQLEVVVKAFESQDKAMIADIINKVDFHCKKLAFKLHEEYDDVVRKCKVEEDPAYVLMRKKAKPINFQKNYGAHPYSVAKALKMDVKEVESFFEAEDKAYPEAKQWEEDVKQAVKNSRVPTSRKVLVAGIEAPSGKGVYRSKTGKRYVFFEEATPPRLHAPRNPKQRPVYTSFSPTQTVNYPIQGLAGEIVWLVLGKVFREFLDRDNFDGKALLTNTIHDSIIFDAETDVAKDAGMLIKECCERVPEYYEDRYKERCNVPFAADLEIGNNLLDMETVL